MDEINLQPSDFDNSESNNEMKAALSATTGNNELTIINIPIERKYVKIVNTHKDKICTIFGFKALKVQILLRKLNEHEIIVEEHEKRRRQRRQQPPPPQQDKAGKQDEKDDEEEKHQMQQRQEQQQSQVERKHSREEQEDESSEKDYASIEVISDSSNCNEDEITKRVQHYVESLAITEAEDSSYDSDCDNEENQNLPKTPDHEQVSRTASDTLGQEFAEYVNNNPSQHQQIQLQQQKRSKQQVERISITSEVPPYSTISSLPSPGAPSTTIGLQQQPSERTPGYTTRVEFALKLGYTERLVQAALARLGPDPTQNELLAELIKLGAQHGNKGDFVCDSPNAECLSPISGSSMSLATSGEMLTGSGSGGILNSGGSGGNASSYIHHHHHLPHHLHHQHSHQQQSHFTTGSGGNSGCNYNDDSNQMNLLRPIVIDGSNVAMSHGNKNVFSCRGIKLCIDWFKNRGHKDITVFVPKWRKESFRLDNPIKDQEILNELERERMLVFTPSRLVGGKRMICYDDRYILKLAVENDGIVVSNDNYRDLIQESSEFKKVVEERVLMYSFVNDRFMPPDDPLGRSGPTLDNFLRIQPKKGDPPPPCPYGKKCTYGNKCKFHHPERGLGPHKSVTERLSEHAARHLSARNSSIDSSRIPVQGKSLSVPLSGSSSNENVSTERLSRKQPLCRTRSGAPDCPTIVPSSSLSSSSLSSLNTLGNGSGKMSSVNCNAVQQSLQGQPKPQPQQQSPIPPSWDLSSCHVLDTHHIGFPKSHSIENISREAYAHSLVGGPIPSYQAMWSQPVPPPTPPTAQSPSAVQQQGVAVVGAQSSTNESVDESVNLHRKLRRQLTLNPGCDPRIYQLQRCITPAGTGSAGTTSPLVASPAAPQSHSPHRPLAPSLSGPRTHHPPTQWDLHQSVTRIASAPDPSRPWHNGPPPASSSEPHINLWPHHHPSPTVLAAQDQRRHLHYHLANIFPEEQVQTVMQMYPEETNPQTICAAILNMFPKM